MKSIFRLIVLTCYPILALAQTPILITYHEQQKWSESIEKIVAKNFSIPKILIANIWKKKPCEPITTALLHICVSDQNQLKIVHANAEQIHRSFKIFQKKE